MVSHFPNDLGSRKNFHRLSVHSYFMYSDAIRYIVLLQGLRQQPPLDAHFPATLVLEENTFSVAASMDVLYTPDVVRYLVLLQGLRQQLSLVSHSLRQQHQRQYMHRSRFQHHRQY